MPRFDQPNLTKLDLPSTKDVADESQRAWVVMDVSPTRIDDTSDAEESDGIISIGIKMLVKRIKEWNFEDENGKPLPIIYDTVKLMKQVDFSHLQEAIKDGGSPHLSDDEKKTSSDTSLQSETVKIQVNE